MAALTADRDTDIRRGEVASYPVKASTTIFAGSIVCVETASGYVVPGSDTAGLVFVGIAREKVDNSSGSSGDLEVEVDCAPGMIAELAATGLAQADGDGTQVYVADDQTVAKSGGSNSIKVGLLREFKSATTAVVMIQPLIA